MAQHPVDSQESSFGWLVSLLFWVVLLIAAVLYGLVALSPKLVANVELRDERYGTQVRLVALERQVSYLERVVAALEGDAAFAAQLARIDFDASRPGEERIAVGEALSLDAREAAPAEMALPREAPWYAPVLNRLAHDWPTRRALLAAAAALTVFAFTFLHESQSHHFENAAGKVQSGAGWLSQRYRTPRERDAA